MRKRWNFVTLLAMTVVLLTGCMYPEEQKIANQIPDVDQLTAVQRAVDEFRAETGVLPIKTRDMDTDIYIKYLIDFEKLVPKYMASTPANSYEKGGIFQYIIWDPEERAVVKLVDLRTPERMREINIRSTTKDYPQFGTQVADFVYNVNFENLGYKEPILIDSPYSNNKLPLVMSSEGRVYVDYSIDLYKFIQENDLDIEPGEDIRDYLVEAYPVVPAYSLPYTVDEKNEPVFMYNPIENK